MKVKKRYAGWIVLAGIVLLTVGCLARYAVIYLNTLVFTERQNQLQEVVAPYFEKIDTVTEQLWRTASALENRLITEQPADVEELQAFFEQEISIQNWEKQGISPIAIRDDGQYLDVDGVHGSLSYTEPLSDCEERTNYIYEPPYTGKMLNLYVYRLENPIRITYKTDTLSIEFVGITQKMETMNQYFRCSSYGNDNSTYILDRYGAKQYVDSSASMNLIEGHNVYGVLRKECEAQGKDFDALLAELASTGIVYSDVEISGQQCFYAMRKMPNTDFVILYSNPADRVATGTAALVHLVMIVFAVMAVGIIVLVIEAAVVMFIRNRRQLAFETQARLELQKLNRELDKTNMDLQQASRAKSEFLANMSHDIRTPMNAIVGITSLMAREPGLSDKLSTYISKVQMSSQHLLSLINDVLDMSKIESSEVSLNCEPVNLAEMIGQVDSIIRSQTNEKGQRFQIRVHMVAHECVISDDVRLRQLLINLLSNATKYTPAGGTITLDLTERAGEQPGYAWYQISVADNGYGMDQEFLKHIFEPFTRAENSVTNKVQGTGLGMAIVKSVVDMMGGTIQVDSVLNQGTCFEVNLPLELDTNADSMGEIGPVLLISDDEVLQQNMKASMQETQTDFDIASSREEAAELIRIRKTELVLLHGHRKDENLAEYTAYLRRQAQSDLLIFLLEDTQTETTEEIFRESGADGLILRPFFRTNLLRAMEQRKGLDSQKKNDKAVLKGLHFLCAEDNKLNAEILEAMLSAEGAFCTICRNGQEIVDAFQKVQPGEYDAILMDVQMPVMNGLEAARAIRSGENPLGRTIPILAMTANAFKEDIQNSLAAGMDAHISKPIDMRVLEREMNRWIPARVREKKILG